MVWGRDDSKSSGGAAVGTRPEQSSGVRSDAPVSGAGASGAAELQSQAVQSVALPQRIQDWRFEKQRAQDRIDALKRYTLEAQGWTANTPVLSARKQDAIDTCKKEIEILELLKLHYEDSIEKLLAESGQLDRLEYILVGKVPTGNGRK